VVGKTSGEYKVERWRRNNDATRWAELFRGIDIQAGLPEAEVVYAAVRSKYSNASEYQRKLTWAAPDDETGFVEGFALRGGGRKTRNSVLWRFVFFPKTPNRFCNELRTGEGVFWLLSFDTGVLRLSLLGRVLTTGRALVEAFRL